MIILKEFSLKGKDEREKLEVELSQKLKETVVIIPANLDVVNIER